MQKPILNLYIFTVSVGLSIYSHKLSVTYGHREEIRQSTPHSCIFIQLLKCYELEMRMRFIHFYFDWGDDQLAKGKQTTKTMAFVLRTARVFVCILANASFCFSSVSISHWSYANMHLLLSFFFIQCYNFIVYFIRSHNICSISSIVLVLLYFTCFCLWGVKPKCSLSYATFIIKMTFLFFILLLFYTVAVAPNRRKVINETHQSTHHFVAYTFHSLRQLYLLRIVA